MSQPGHQYWNAKPDIRLEQGENLYAWAARNYREYCQGKTRLYLFSEWLPQDPKQLEEQVGFWSDVTRTHGFDGIDMHEAWNFESDPANMALLGRMAKSFGIQSRKSSNQ